MPVLNLVFVPNSFMRLKKKLKPTRQTKTKHVTMPVSLRYSLFSRICDLKEEWCLTKVKDNCRKKSN